ncbi:hypothetical protein [Dethiosulfatarculus sandiegensis]|uniref:Uncharacterized protein n=1 Tax=Dethiosulfatarculus sandiegensis TaxID=1429043 RepID=A0A0D2HTR5_9BACT|nr:hypothetical protein [Dethiosulfatarculus sandiegensis]KIX13873.1 hypothetical protein X474_11590 [Dethiosulfatarculus sandiegensis]
MAVSNAPTAAERRNLLSTESPKLAEAAKAYFEEGRLGEALDCYKAAGDTEGLKAVCQKAVLEGDFFWWKQAHQMMGNNPPIEEAAELAKNAGEKGKDSFARTASELLNHGKEDE